ncbi:MAG: DUF4150 domain-containing protein [Gammaproteobacteria bacterium]|nr:DUF4150 domain-containing protein [Gammaproteobacteria bacterium]MDH3468064.1 DUF4150 domain-containing protein [Gammaproteobacteria bacterium]
MPASTNGGGSCATTGPTDVCKTPTPGGPVPMPYPNLAQNTQVQGSSASKRVKIINKKGVVVGTNISMSAGDEPGSAGGGVVSNKIKGKCTFKTGSSKVKFEGKKACYHGSMTGMNGTPNNTVGAQVAPSQTKVKVMP